VEQALFLLVRGLAAGVLLPALAAAAAGRRLRPAALTAVFVMVSALGALVTTGMVPAPSALPLIELMRNVRELPDGQFPGAAVPHLHQLAAALAQGTGRTPAPETVGPAVERMAGVLARARAMPRDEFEHATPRLVHELLVAAQADAILGALTWSPGLDGALVVPLAAGLTGGWLVGLVTGLLAALVRTWLAAIPLELAVPTVLAGLAGAAGAGWCARGSPARRAFALGAATGAAQAAWAGWLAPSSAAVPPAVASGVVLALIQATGLALFALITGAQRLAEEHGRLRQSELQARLDLLAAQVRPHFLFNALNTIASTAGEPERCRHLIDCLARFFRSSLKPGEGRVRLSDELAALEPYLELERARYPDRLTVTVDADPAACAGTLPGLVLQPLIENAVVHGLKAGGEPLAVRVSARVVRSRAATGCASV
jgi:hypothetical protein